MKIGRTCPTCHAHETYEVAAVADVPTHECAIDVFIRLLVELERNKIKFFSEHNKQISDAIRGEFELKVVT